MNSYKVTLKIKEGVKRLAEREGQSFSAWLIQLVLNAHAKSNVRIVTSTVSCNEGQMMSECSKCGGEMIRGEAYIDIETPSNNIMMSPVMSPTTAMNGWNTGRPQEKRIKWREKTGEKKGFLIKGDEIRTIAITGKRCLICGYIEFYARD